MNCKRKAVRWFGLSFCSSLLFILCTAGIVYLSCNEEGGAKEAAITFTFPSHTEEKISVSFLGSRWEFSPKDLEDVLETAEQGSVLLGRKIFPARLIYVIPVKYRIYITESIFTLQKAWKFLTG